MGACCKPEQAGFCKWLSSLLRLQERPRGRGDKEGEVEEGSVGPAGRKTLETLGAADAISDALEMAAEEVQRQQVAAHDLGSITLLAQAWEVLQDSSTWQ